MFQHDLFRVIPDKRRHKHLLNIFDVSLDPSEPLNVPSLRKERLPDVAALLTTFIAEMTEPLISRALFSAFWAWCVRPTITREQEHNKEVLSDEEDCSNIPLPPLLTPKSLWRKHPKTKDKSSTTAQENAKAEKTQEELDKEEKRLDNIQIVIAQHVLQLLPPANLSLLGYFCSFFSQLPLCPENGIAYEDVGRLFAHKILGGPNKICSKTVMVWLLSRWDRIGSGIFGEEDTGNRSQRATAHKEELSLLQKRLSSCLWGDNISSRRGSAPLPVSELDPTHDGRARSQSMYVTGGGQRGEGLPRNNIGPFSPVPSDSYRRSLDAETRTSVASSTSSNRQNASRLTRQRPSGAQRGRPHASSTSSSEASSSTAYSDASSSATQLKNFENTYCSRLFDHDWKKSDHLSVVRELDDDDCDDDCDDDDDTEQHDVSVTAQILDDSFGTFWIYLNCDDSNYK